MTRSPDSMAWLDEVKEVRHPISLNRPLWVRHAHVRSGPPLPQPSALFPESHPYCEFHFHFEGRAVQLIGAEEKEKKAGDLMLMGPGTPHRGIYQSYPQRWATIHFLPMLLLEMGPEGDGARILTRFTAAQTIDDRIVHLPTTIRKRIAGCFKQIVVEFEKREVGSELALRSLLMCALVEFIRWEKEARHVSTAKSSDINWQHIEKALRFIHQHYADPLYVKQIAQASGLTALRLQSSFQEALGMSCIQYLRTYRISHAAALLASPTARVTEVALAVGFETFSHFNTSFRNLMGMSPTEYMKSRRQNRS